MFIDLVSLFWITLFAACILLWWQSLKIKEVALAYTRRYCKTYELQLLDDNVNLRGLWFKRNEQGMVKVWRSYNFEFSSTGDERYGGKVVLLGRKVTNFELDPYRVSEDH